MITGILAEFYLLKKLACRLVTRGRRWTIMEIIIIICLKCEGKKTFRGPVDTSYPVSLAPRENKNNLLRFIAWITPIKELNSA